ncbi:hypothetical protein PPYR_09120 [Photinus pyralis]|uniref:Uncharacterized protein n=2 Tax=Photinus pyralis TaxID=7054 RepID=A0A5N4ALD5_PHOPY|nr:probable multidrug resistance-associated protein lethal(2)03659 isoform X2 [Photinus pyralis]KAB0798127.1 hypothetical protein PPYR_09120 [Photinus pyralis]
MDFTKKYDNPNPEVSANPISKLLYWWLFRLFYNGYKKDIEAKDLYSINKCDYSEKLGNIMERNWQEECSKAKSEDRQPQFIRVIKKTFIKPYSLYGIELFLLCIILKMLQPIVLAKYIKYFDASRSNSVTEGWLLASALIAMTLLEVTVMHHASLGQTRLGMQCRIGTCSLIYRKLLRLNKASTANTAAGQIVNLLSNDVLRFDLAPFYLHYLWIMPIQTIVAAFIVYDSIGYATFAGFAALIIQAIPLQGYLSYLQGKLRLKIANRTDQRVQLMNEITNGIQVIKMYAWEKPFEEMVKQARKREIDIIGLTSYIRGLLVSVMMYTEKLTFYLTIVTYVLLGNSLSGDKVFSIAQLFSTIELYMAVFYPIAVSFYAEAKISVSRIEKFLIQEEVDMPQSMEAITLPKDPAKLGMIKIHQGKASWVPNPIIYTLTNINLNLKPGSLCAVVGQVGSGKSSFLQLLLKELPLISGVLEISGEVSYASQEPWLFVSTVRNNILFGTPYVRQRYKEIVKVCALERDFELFPNGDKTLVGERGISLSGGQRARINLARSVYREADIYLFDDPLSAVDTHVAKHLFEECLLKYLANKTRILVTHQLQFLKKADLIVILDNGQIKNMGTYEELAEKELAHLKLDAPDEQGKAPDDRPRLMSIVSQESIQHDDETDPQETQELVEKGALSSSVYLAYIRAGGPIVLLGFFVIMFILAHIVYMGCDIWLRYWTNEEEQNKLPDPITISPIFLNDQNLTFLESTTINYEINYNDTFHETTPYSLQTQYRYIYIYTGLILLTIFLTILRSMLFFKICMNASKGLHNTMFGNVLKATMRFFDTNPSGRILNRFSKDMGAIDEILPKALIDAIQIFAVMFGIVALVFLVTPWMVIPTVILAVLFYFIRKVYLCSAQNIKRLEGITRAPAFSHISASFSGLSTIRSSKRQAIIIKEFDVLQDQHTAAWFLFISTSEAFGFYLDVISVIFLAILTFQFIIFDDGTTLAGDVGLLISQSLALTGMLQWGIRQTAEVASQMTSVERILQYTRLDKEGSFDSLPTNKPPRDWPQHGQVKFQNVVLEYVPGESVLNNLNFVINPGEKVGVVGRTGAGKSSLIAALFRLAPTQGLIKIDDVDISVLGLHDLRSKISIIPQEPVLFSASVRHNLDPLNKCEDKVLWKSLEDVELKQIVSSLDQEIKEGGTNFSIGQRQLFCLARAIIKNNKLLIMDEATANVDLQTDAFIQQTIRKNFKNCTVLTIAHRLNTIMDSDKVLVMDAGQAVEYGQPHELLKSSNGYFTRMVKETGPATENKLRGIAEEYFKKDGTS